MTDLQKTILQKASGENRLDPDQQRLYMGTFRERVLLTLSFSEATSKDFQGHFSDICKELKDKYPQLFLKISPNLSDSLQISLMKEAQAIQITTTIVDEKLAASQFALLFHTDHAVDLEHISLDQVFQIYLNKRHQKRKKRKDSGKSSLAAKGPIGCLVRPI